MTPEQMQEFRDFEEMFGTAGWQKFIKQTTETRQATLDAAPDSAVNNETWQYCRGMLAQMQITMGFETYVSAVKEQILADEAEQDE